MLAKSFSLLFYLKKTKELLVRFCAIYMRITDDGATREIANTPKSETEHWNKLSGRSTDS